MEKLTIALLIALSVSDLTEHLSVVEYSDDELQEAISAEAADKNRVTALEALAAAMSSNDDDEQEESRKPGMYVCAGKAVTTHAGMKSDGDKITDGMVSSSAVKSLIKKGFLEVQK